MFCRSTSLKTAECVSGGGQLISRFVLHSGKYGPIKFTDFMYVLMVMGGVGCKNKTTERVLPVLAHFLIISAN
jgi:hypothetical protein